MSTVKSSSEDLTLNADGAGNDVVIQSNGTTKAIVTAEGNVGIGTTLPAKTLDIDGQFRVRNGGATGYALLEYGVSSTATNNWHVGSEGDGSFRFYNGNFGSGTERMRIDSSGNLKFNSGYGSVTTAYGCRAWINFNGTGTVSIFDSGNISSVTDNGTGQYTLNFATNMPDGNYAIATTNASLNNNLSYYAVGLRNQNPPDVKSTSQVRIQVGNSHTGGASDAANISVTIFR